MNTLPLENLVQNALKKKFKPECIQWITNCSK